MLDYFRRFPARGFQAASDQDTPPESTRVAESGSCCESVRPIDPYTDHAGVSATARPPLTSVRVRARPSASIASLSFTTCDCESVPVSHARSESASSMAPPAKTEPLEKYPVD